MDQGGEIQRKDQKIAKLIEEKAKIEQKFGDALKVSINNVHVLIGKHKQV